MVNKYDVLSVLALILLLAMPASAQSSTDGKPAVTVNDLDAIMQEEIVFKAMAARAKQRAELGQYADEAQSVGLANSNLPQVAWRRSTASGWLAKFILEGGASLIASTGEHLPGGFVIAQIDDRGVKLRRDGEVLELTAASSKQLPVELTSPNPAHPGTFR